MAKATHVPGLGPQTRLAEAAPAVLRSRLAGVLVHGPKVARGAPPAAVHDMRVATRRLRAALQLFGAPREASACAKRLQDALGAVRDAQLHAAFLGAELPARKKALVLALSRFRREARRLRIEIPAAGGPRGRLGGHRLRKHLRERLRRIDELIQPLTRAAGKPHARKTHLLRIAVKKLRYRVELLRPALPAESDELLRALAPLQDALGELHDLDVRLGLDPSVDPAARERLAVTLQRRLRPWLDERRGRAFRRLFE